MDNPSTKIGLRSLPKRQIILTMAGVLLAMFMSSLDQTIVDTAMPRIIVDLNGFAHYTWVITVYIITSAVTIPIIGKLTDMYGRKRFYIAGIVIFTVASVLSGLSHSMLQLIIFRGIQGIGPAITDGVQEYQRYCQAQSGDKGAVRSLRQGRYAV